MTTKAHVRRLLWLLGAVGLSFYLIGCGNGPPDDGSPAVYNFMESRARLRAMVHCRARYETCPGKPPPDARGATAASCLRRTVDKWDDLGDESAETFGVDPSILQAVEAGAIDYDAEAAGSCLESFRSYVHQLSCIQARRLESMVVRGVIERDLIPVCDEVFTPTVEEGEKCETTLECRDDLACRRETGDEGDCGRCRDVSGGNSGAGFTYALEGESCGSPNHTPTCDPTKPLLCESAESGGWTCQPETSKEKGEDCQSFGICEDGLACLDGICKSFEIADAGEACGTGNTYCEQPLICRASGGDGRVCGELSRAGESCRANADCAGDLWCGPADRGDDERGTCTGKLEEGESCEPGRCADGLYCPRDWQPKDETCRSRGDRGETCSDQRECQAGLRCRWSSSAGERTCQGSDEMDGSETSIEDCRP